MDPSELAALVQGQIDDARRYVSEELAADREKALEFVRGEVDLVAEKGKSQVVSRDLSDVLGWIMPSLLRQFLGSDRVVIYEPRKREMVTRPKMGEDGQPVIDPQTGQPVPERVDLGKERADQATDYVNYVFLSETDGYCVLAEAIYDGLLLGNGIIKYWWDQKPEYKTETLRGLSEDELAMVLQDVPKEDILGHSAYAAERAPGQAGLRASPEGSGDLRPPGLQPMGAEPALGPAPGNEGGYGPDMGAPDLGGGPVLAANGVDFGTSGVPIVLVHDVAIRRIVSQGRLCIEALPPEDFLIERNSTKLDEKCRGCGHRYRATRSDLIEQGFDPEVVEDLPTASYTRDQTTQLSRDGRTLRPAWTGGQDRSIEEVDVVEWFPLVDMDGDGVAERLRVIKGDLSNEEGILLVEPWEDDLPFADLVPDPIPHQWKGKSLFEEMYDIVRVKTALLRQTQDNLYQVNNPMNLVLDGQVMNMDVLINRVLGGIVFAKSPTAVTALEVPFTADKSFAMLDYWDRVVERRGFSFASGTLDMDALTRQTATGVNAIQQAGAVKPESYARNMAEVGLRRLFRGVLRLITKYQDKPRTIRLRGKWVDADPASWDPDMDVSINTGLGSGSRERDAAALMAVAAKQEQILQTMPNNPMVTVDRYRNTLAKGCEALGLKGPEQYFAEITPEQAQAIVNQPPKPDPKMVEAQARMQLDQAKAVHAAQIEQAKTAHAAGLEQAKMEHQQQLAEALAVAEHKRKLAEIQAMAAAAQEKAALELQTERDKAAVLLRMEEEKIVLNARLKREELQLEAELKREEMRMAGPRPQSDNIEEARPQ
jgi:hypothetical protein